MKPFITLSLIGLLTLLFSFAQETPTNPDKSEKASESGSDPFSPAIGTPALIRVQVEYIELSHKALTRLLMEDKAETTDATALRMKAQELVEKDEARILDTQLIIARSGDKAESESHREFIYPTEYTPSPFPLNPDNEKSGGELGNMLINSGTPTAFETKNIGSFIEIEPRLGNDNRVIDLRFLLNHVWHTGDTVWLETKDKLGNISKSVMPNFYVLSVDTAMNCIPGQYVLVSVLSPKNAEGKLDTEKKVMVFVKCKILPVVP